MGLSDYYSHFRDTLRDSSRCGWFPSGSFEL
jgi:hypothetical protein